MKGEFLGLQLQPIVKSRISLRCADRVLIRKGNIKGSGRRERSFDTAKSESLGIGISLTLPYLAFWCG